MKSLLHAFLQEEREEPAHEELLEQEPEDWGRGAASQEGSLGKLGELPCLHRPAQLHPPLRAAEEGRVPVPGSGCCGGCGGAGS